LSLQSIKVSEFILSKFHEYFQGGVRFPTGGKAANADKPASGKSTADFGLIPKPTVQSGWKKRREQYEL
jgi:hypothetical protein